MRPPAGERERAEALGVGAGLGGAPPRGPRSFWKWEARVCAKSLAPDGVLEEQHEGAGRVLAAGSGAPHVRGQSGGACGSQRSQGRGRAEHMQIGGLGQRLRGRWAPGAPGRAQQMVSRPAWLDQKRARRPLSPGLGEKFQLCLDGNWEPGKMIEREWAMV